VRGRQQLVLAVRAGEQDPLRADETVQRRLAPRRDPRHRVRQMAVERREEPEAVLGGQAVGRRIGAGLAAGERALLIDRHGEPALGQLVGRRQAADAPTQHCHGGRHGQSLRTPSVFAYHTLRRVQRLPGTPDEVFPFFADAGNLEAITPPWLAFRVITPRPIELHAGALIEYRLKLHRLPISWLTRIEEWEPGVRFVDAQLSGPYKLWHHTHEFEPDGERHTLMRDTVRYALPFGPLGEIAHRAFVARDLQRIFDYRRDYLTVSVPSMPAERWPSTGQ
jgi:ligand-binding SRPBCC domain-containing protein